MNLLPCSGSAMAWGARESNQVLHDVPLHRNTRAVPLVGMTVEIIRDKLIRFPSPRRHQSLKEWPSFVGREWGPAVFRGPPFGAVIIGPLLIGGRRARSNNGEATTREQSWALCLNYLSRAVNSTLGLCGTSHISFFTLGSALSIFLVTSNCQVPNILDISLLISAYWGKIIVKSIGQKHFNCIWGLYIWK